MKKIIALFLLLAFAHIGQAQILVSYEKADQGDFSKFKTFQVYSLDVKNIPEFEPKKEGLNLLIGEINKQMISRGYEKVKANPDLIINVGVSITAEVQTRETTIRDAPMYIGQRNYKWESEEVIVREYTEGTVTLDIVDTSENELIWQAVTSGILEKNQNKIAKGVQKLFKKYPVKPLE
jgi:hypothetical protein